uniref:C17orf113 probable zinc finger domain-containing protein n=1 Tax=Romanomermis culicivorax TaxID=13658 RepID=A0A915JPE5_ROMCU
TTDNLKQNNSSRESADSESGCSDDEEIVVRNEESNSKAKRSKTYYYRASWCTKFPWLTVTDKQKILVVCNICRESGGKNAWASGKSLPDWRTSNLTDHEKSKAHKDSVENSKVAPKNVFQQAHKNLTEKSSNEIIMIMKKVLFVVQEGAPIYLSSKLHKLISHLCKAQENQLILPKHHGSNLSTYEFIAVLNQSIYDSVTKVLNNDIGFTLHVNESTDVAEQKHLILYATHVEQKTAEPATTFLGLVEVSKVAILIQCCYKNCRNAKTNFESFEFERYQRAQFTIKKFVMKLKNAIENRLDTDNEVLRWFRIFEPSAEMANFDAEQWNIFGTAELNCLVEKYALLGLSNDDLMNEWQEFKRSSCYKNQTTFTFESQNPRRVDTA